MVFRWLILLLLTGAAVCFALYAASGQQKFRRYGWWVLRGTLVAAFLFFAVLAVERFA